MMNNTPSMFKTKAFYTISLIKRSKAIFFLKKSVRSLLKVDVQSNIK